jgi:hypothetical protein
LSYCAARLVAAPLFKKIGLGTVLGYLAAGIVIGPLLRIISDGEEILHFAELGRGAAAVRHRTGTQTIAFVADAARHFRAGPGAGDDFGRR